jgi:hypothetical protein
MSVVRALSLSALSIVSIFDAFAAPASDAPSDPLPSALAVGAMQIASDANLLVEQFDVDVAADKVVYAYSLTNSGAADLNLTASVAAPELRASADGEESWTLAADDAENPMALTVTSGGAPVATTAELRLTALGLDRLAQVKSAGLPLIPFGAAVEKALAGLAPETVDRLAALGVVSPRDPSNPKGTPQPDWTLNVTRIWRETLPAGQTTAVAVTFAPIKAEYRLGKGDEATIADAKDDLCLSAAKLEALQSRLKSGGPWQITEFELDLAPPAHWLDSPPATISVKKPKPDSIVAFCGMDESSAHQAIVVGTAPSDAGDSPISVAIFTPAAE